MAVPFWSLAALCFPLCFAERASYAAELLLPGSEAVAARLKYSEGIICGTAKIKEALVSGSQNVPWAEIVRMAEGYLAKQEFELEAVLVKIKLEQANLEKALQAEAVADFSADGSKLTELMGPVFEVFESAAMMKESFCGAKRVGKRRFSDVYEPAILSFQMSITSALKEQMFTMNDGDVTAQTCLSILGMESVEGRDADACKSICAEIASQARNLTSTLALRGRGAQPSKDIEAELERLRGMAQSLKTLMGDCANGRDELVRFKEEMEVLDTQLVDERSVYAAASSKLREATFDLEDLEEQAAEHTKVLGRLLEILDQMQLVESGLQVELQNVEAEASEVQKAISEHTVRLRQVEAQIGAAQEASAATRDFRSKLANLLLQMLLSFDGAVRTPLQLLGLGRGVNIVELFPSSAIESVRSSTLAALQDMVDFCEKDSTRDAFGKAQEAVRGSEEPTNFGELCEVSDVSSIAGNFGDIVQQRVDGVVKLLVSAQSWMYDFKGQKQADESNSSSPSAEPEGLRKIVSIYNESPFYKGYLKNWKIGGTFQRYYVALALALKQSQETEEQLMEELYGFQRKLQGLMKQIQDTNERLDAALISSKEAGMNVDEAQQVAAQMESSRLSMQQTVAQLTQNAVVASKGVESARRSVEKTYVEATAFLQVLQTEMPKLRSISSHSL